MANNSVVITSATRTAVGSLNKSLRNIPGYILGSKVITESINISKLKAFLNGNMLKLKQLQIKLSLQ